VAELCQQKNTPFLNSYAKKSVCLIKPLFLGEGGEAGQWTGTARGESMPRVYVWGVG